jgi:hypothetical protein
VHKFDIICDLLGCRFRAPCKTGTRFRRFQYSWGFRRDYHRHALDGQPIAWMKLSNETEPPDLPA